MRLDKSRFLVPAGFFLGNHDQILNITEKLNIFSKSCCKVNGKWCTINKYEIQKGQKVMEGF